MCQRILGFEEQKNNKYNGGLSLLSAPPPPAECGGCGAWWDGESRAGKRAAHAHHAPHRPDAELCYRCTYHIPTSLLHFDSFKLFYNSNLHIFFNHFQYSIFMSQKLYMNTINIKRVIQNDLPNTKSQELHISKAYNLET